MTAILARQLKLCCYGKDVQAFRRVGAVLLHRPPPGAPLWYQRTFNLNARQLAKDVQDELGVARTGVVGPATMQEIRDADEASGFVLVDDYADQLFAQALVQFSKPKRKVPNLGPIRPGGQTILQHDLTHATGAIDGYPAFDDAFGAGSLLIAPEALEVTRLSSARRRDGHANGKAFYATGASGIEYWFGHVDGPPAVGCRIKKGKRLATVSGNHEEPHAHVGVNAEPLIGHELIHHTDYTHGAPTVGEQLRKWAKG